MATRIREARQARGWSQQDLAERVGVSQPTIVHWEQGTHTPRNLALARLADTLGVSSHWLRDAPASPPTSKTERSTGFVDKSTHQPPSYLTTPIYHVPVFGGPLDSEEIEACLDGRRQAITYVPVALSMTRPLGILIDDVAMARSFPQSSIGIVDYADKSLVDGKMYLVSLHGVAKLRRYGAFPARLETDRPEDTIHLYAQPKVLGRLVMSVRHL